MPSSVVSAKHYDPKTKILRVIYTSGAVYDYLDVPEEVYEEMNKAFSKGVFLNTRIKAVYDYKKIK